MPKTIFARETKADAEAQRGVVADVLRDEQPRLGDLKDGSRDDVLADMDVPRGHWPPIASTSPPERGSREIKRRADVIGLTASRFAPQRRRRRPPRRRADAGDQRRTGRRPPLHAP
jgi:transposase-like protein